MRGRKLVPHFFSWCIMFEVLIIAAIAGLAVLTGVKCKAAGSIALGILATIQFIAVGIFLLATAAIVVIGIWWAIDTYII